MIENKFYKKMKKSFVVRKLLVSSLYQIDKNMKKLFLSIALLLSTSALFAQKDLPFKPAKSTITFYKTGDSIYHKVNWVQTIGSAEEISKEATIRRALVYEYKQDGYFFTELVANPKKLKGLFMLFVKTK